MLVIPVTILDQVSGICERLHCLNLLPLQSCTEIILSDLKVIFPSITRH